MAPSRTITVSFSGHEVHEVGAVLVTVLAHPRDDDQEWARSSLHASLCACVLRAQYDPDDTTPRLIKPVHAFRDLKDIDKDLRSLKNRIQDRMAAARMAIAFLQEAAGKRPKLPPGIKQLSLNQLSEMVLADTRENMPENVETRVWRVSVPVVHIAAAITVLTDILARNGHQLTIGHLVMDRQVIEWVVREAEAYEGLLERSRRRIDAAKLVKIRLVD
jgi:hypothetical protein